MTVKIAMPPTHHGVHAMPFKENCREVGGVDEGMEWVKAFGVADLLGSFLELDCRDGGNRTSLWDHMVILS